MTIMWDGYLLVLPKRYVSIPATNQPQCIPQSSILKDKDVKFITSILLYYNYDLGDNWMHRLVLEDIVAEEDSVTLMAGQGACPPEDSNGLDSKGYSAYADFLKAYKRNPKKQKMKEAMKEASRSINYSKPWAGGPPIPFKPLEFNIEYLVCYLAS